MVRHGAEAALWVVAHPKGRPSVSMLLSVRWIGVGRLGSERAAARDERLAPAWGWHLDPPDDPPGRPGSADPSTGQHPPACREHTPSCHATGRLQPPHLPGALPRLAAAPVLGALAATSGKGHDLIQRAQGMMPAAAVWCVSRQQQAHACWCSW